MKHNLETIIKVLQQYLELGENRPHPNKIFLAVETEINECKKELQEMITTTEQDIVERTTKAQKDIKQGHIFEPIERANFCDSGFIVALKQILGDSE